MRRRVGWGCRLKCTHIGYVMQTYYRVGGGRRIDNNLSRQTTETQGRRTVIGFLRTRSNDNNMHLKSEIPETSQVIANCIKLVQLIRLPFFCLY